MTTLEVLKEARELLSDPKRWTKGENARDEDGCPVDELSDDAVCWCVEGAIWKAGERIRERYDAWSLLCKETGVVAQSFNDSPSTTHADVLAAFDRAIAKLETP